MRRRSDDRSLCATCTKVFNSSKFWEPMLKTFVQVAQSEKASHPARDVRRCAPSRNRTGELHKKLGYVEKFLCKLLIFIFSIINKKLKKFLCKLLIFIFSIINKKLKKFLCNLTIFIFVRLHNFYSSGSAS